MAGKSNKSKALGVMGISVPSDLGQHYSISVKKGKIDGEESTLYKIESLDSNKPEIFTSAEALPQYEFIVCQDQELTKNEYHNLLGEAKMVFSASLQETLGIGCYEGALVDAIPLVPDRLSYTEMYYKEFKYDSAWTYEYEMYKIHKPHLCQKIIELMTNYEKQLPQLRKQAYDLSKYFFSAGALLENLR